MLIFLLQLVGLTIEHKKTLSTETRKMYEKTTGQNNTISQTNQTHLLPLPPSVWAPHARKQTGTQKLEERANVPAPKHAH